MAGVPPPPTPPRHNLPIPGESPHERWASNHLLNLAAGNQVDFALALKALSSVCAAPRGSRGGASFAASASGTSSRAAGKAPQIGGLSLADLDGVFPFDPTLLPPTAPAAAAPPSATAGGASSSTAPAPTASTIAAAFASVVKGECDIVGRGFFPPDGFEDVLPRNRWTEPLKPVVPGRPEAASASPPTQGRQPKLGHIARAPTPRRFLVQLNKNDLYMLVVPEAFQRVLKEWLRIPLPRVVPVSACEWCDEWVQVNNFDGKVVLQRNWPDIVNKYDLEEMDVVEFKLQAFGLKMTIYKRATSTAQVYTFPEHD